MVEMPSDRVTEYYNHQIIFITGATGAVGRVLIEKLLRTTESKLFILVRPKHDKSPTERLDTIFKNMLFDTLRKEKPDAFQRCHIILGNVFEKDFGISTPDKERLQSEVTMVFHLAGNVRFDVRLEESLMVNTRGTLYALDLAQQLPNLKLFAHVSTAYTYFQEEILYERFYDPPADPYKVLELIEKMKNDPTGNFAKSVLGDYPNGYSFSKALSEALVVDHKDKLPILILRPSMGIPTFSEPLPGWCSTFQGLCGLFVGGGKGVIRTCYLKEEVYADFIPYDIMAKQMLLATWYFQEIDHNSTRVYHLTTGDYSRVNVREGIEAALEITRTDLPFNGTLGYPTVKILNSKWLYYIYFVILQVIPSIFLDGLLILLGYKPLLCKIQKRIFDSMSQLEFYGMRPWKFNNDEAYKVLPHLNETEIKNYEVLPSGPIDIKKYLRDSILTFRRNNLKETDEMLPAARRHMKRMWWLHQVLKVLFYTTCIYYFYKWIWQPTWKYI